MYANAHSWWWCLYLSLEWLPDSCDINLGTRFRYDKTKLTNNKRIRKVELLKAACCYNNSSQDDLSSLEKTKKSIWLTNVITYICSACCPACRGLSGFLCISCLFYWFIKQLILNVIIHYPFQDVAHQTFSGSIVLDAVNIVWYNFVPD